MTVAKKKKLLWQRKRYAADRCSEEWKVETE